MEIKELVKEYVGKKLISIIDINLGCEEVVSALKEITGDEYSSDIENAKLLMFEGQKALVFVDYGDDEYRSGDWHLVQIGRMLDKGQTNGIKFINSIVRNIEYFDNVKGIPDEYSEDTVCILITTDEYIIRMGQEDMHDYYPCNFFDLQECKDVALGIKEE